MSPREYQHAVELVATGLMSREQLTDYLVSMSPPNHTIIAREHDGTSLTTSPARERMAIKMNPPPLSELVEATEKDDGSRLRRFLQ